MNVARIPGMLFTPAAGWTDVLVSRPPAIRLMHCVFGPAAMLPPLMIVLASDTLGRQLLPQASLVTWFVIAFIVLVIEYAALPLMTWLIMAVAQAHGGYPDAYRAFTLAVFAPIPIWLASITLPSANSMLILGALLVGAAASTALVRHGTRALLAVQEPEEAGYTAFTVLCAGAGIWAAFIAMVLIPAVVVR